MSQGTMNNEGHSLENEGFNASRAKVVISLKDIVKRYIDRAKVTMALDGINVDFYEGEFITIQGSSGCGKTTLLNMVGLMDTPTKGDVIFMGKSTADLTDDEKADIRASDIGFIFQFYNLMDHLSAIDNVALGLAPEGLRGRKDIGSNKDMLDLAKKALCEVGLGERLDNTPDELSGGEQQRVAIARALVKRPKVIICDEPTGDLDTKNRNDVLERLKELNEKHGHLVLIVTHDPSIGEMGKRRIKMEDYKIVSDTLEG